MNYLPLASFLQHEKNSAPPHPNLSGIADTVP